MTDVLDYQRRPATVPCRHCGDAIVEVAQAYSAELGWVHAWNGERDCDLQAEPKPANDVTKGES